MGTYDGTEMKLFVDGTFVASQPATGSIPAASANVVIGSQEDGANYFEGLIDEVQIYDRALSDPEVLQLFQDFGTPGDTPPDTTPPTQPDNLSIVDVGLTHADIIWSPSSDRYGSMTWARTASGRR